jgi:SAM-dependent methyltransferase
MMVRPAFDNTIVTQCRSCNLSFLAPPPVRPEQVYGEEYFQAYAALGLRFPTESDEVPIRYRERLKQAEQEAEGRGVLLEIGVGHGAFLNLAQAAGWQTLGIEVSEYAARMAREKYGLEVFCGTLEDAGIREASIDVVHMSHVLEHLKDPLRTLSEIMRILRPGGILVIEVPNELDSLQVRVLRLAGLVRAYSVKSTHLFFFSPWTLTQLVRNAGYEIRRTRTLRDTRDSRLSRRCVKAAASLVENPIRMGPLIEVFAARPARTG